MSNQVSLTIIAVCQIILTAAIFIAVAGLIYAIFAFKKMISDKIDEAMGRVQPVVDQARGIAEQARDTAEKVSNKVDSIMMKAETTADRVGEKVQSVSERVETAINPQVAAAAGIVGSAVKCVQLFNDITKIRDTIRQSSTREGTIRVAPEEERGDIGQSV